MKRLFLLLLMANLTLAVCEGITSLAVPAVTGDNRSEMVRISVEVKDGNGEAFTSVTPSVGFFTQESERIAAEVAFRLTGRRDCDVFLRIQPANDISSVDGPSAGAAITLMTLSTLTKKPLRDDFSITGTIEEDGSIGPVGEIPLKAEAVSSLGKDLFLVPSLGYTDKISLMVLQERFNVTVVEVGTIDQAYNITTSATKYQSTLMLEPEGVQEFKNSTIFHPSVEYFKEITSRMIDNAEKKVSAYNGEAKANFESRLLNARAAFESGSYYTAANIAFLLMIDVDYMNFSDASLSEHRAMADECIKGFVPRQTSVENFELSAPATVRYLWAKNRMPNETQFDFVAMKLQAYRDILYAEQWCAAAQELANYPTGNETAFDEGTLESVAKDLLLNATTTAEKKKSEEGVENPDTEWHLGIARDAFNTKMYIPSIIESSYVISASVNETDKNMTFGYLWPQLYAAHAGTYGGTDVATENRLMAYAGALENSFTIVEVIGRNATGLKNITSPQNVTVGSELLNVSGLPELKKYTSEITVIIGIFVLVMLAFIVWYMRELNMKKKRTGVK